MKKNKAMRAAGALFVATMLSTSVISGTYAKYVVSDSANDTARVAKFGVMVTADGYLFSDTYKDVNNPTDGNGNTPGTAGDKNDIKSGRATNLTVVSSGSGYTGGAAPNNIVGTSVKDGYVMDSSAPSGTQQAASGIYGTDHVIAPGTKNDTGLIFSITGKPEVDVQLTIDVTDSSGYYAPADIFLATGTYPDMTNGNVMDKAYQTTDAFKVDTNYYPVVYTLKHYAGDAAPADWSVGTTVATGNLAAIKTYLETNLNKAYDANTDLGQAAGGFYQLTWEWKFSVKTEAEMDALQDAVNTAQTNLDKAVNADEYNQWGVNGAQRELEAAIAELDAAKKENLVVDRKDTLLGDLADEFTGSIYGNIDADLDATVATKNDGIVSKAYVAYNASEAATAITGIAKNPEYCTALKRVNYFTAADKKSYLPAPSAITNGMYSINADVAISITVTQID